MVTDRLAHVLAQYSLGLCAEVEVLHHLTQCMFSELPHLEKMDLAKFAELLRKLLIMLEAYEQKSNAASSDLDGSFSGKLPEKRRSSLQAVHRSSPPTPALRIFRSLHGGNESYLLSDGSLS